MRKKCCDDEKQLSVCISEEVHAFLKECKKKEKKPMGKIIEDHINKTGINEANPVKGENSDSETKLTKKVENLEQELKDYKEMYVNFVLQSNKDYPSVETLSGFIADYIIKNGREFKYKALRREIKKTYDLPPPKVLKMKVIYNAIQDEIEEELEGREDKDNETT